MPRKACRFLFVISSLSLYLLVCVTNVYPQCGADGTKPCGSTRKTAIKKEPVKPVSKPAAKSRNSITKEKKVVTQPKPIVYKQPDFIGFVSDSLLRGAVLKKAFGSTSTDVIMAHLQWFNAELQNDPLSSGAIVISGNNSAIYSTKDKVISAIEFYQLDMARFKFYKDDQNSELLIKFYIVK